MCVPGVLVRLTSRWLDSRLNYVVGLWRFGGRDQTSLRSLTRSCQLHVLKSCQLAGLTGSQSAAEPAAFRHVMSCSGVRLLLPPASLASASSAYPASCLLSHQASAAQDRTEVLRSIRPLAGPDRLQPSKGVEPSPEGAESAMCRMRQRQWPRR